MAQIAMTPARFSLVTIPAGMGMMSRQFSGSVYPDFGTHQLFQTHVSGQTPAIPARSRKTIN